MIVRGKSLKVHSLQESLGIGIPSGFKNLDALCDHI
jgi:hypothetical protein